MAAKWNEMTFERFIELDGVEQSRLVATYETAMQIEAVRSADMLKQVRRKTVKRGGYGA